VISARVPADGPALLLLAPVRGLTSEVAALVAALEGHAPEAVGLGLSGEEMQGLLDYFVLADAEPIVPLSSMEMSEVRGLSRFGEVRVPNPAFVEVLRWGRARSLPIQALDPDDERSASLFAEHIGYVELVRRTVREHRISRSPPTPASADEFAIQWDHEVAAGRGSRAFARARDRHLARAVQRLGQGRSRTAVVVDRERFEAVRDLLRAGVPSAMGDD
jgi:hypothetical protein